MPNWTLSNIYISLNNKIIFNHFVYQSEKSQQVDHDESTLFSFIESKINNAALLLKLSEYDTMYDLFEDILDGARVDEENIQRACSDIKTYIHSYLQETIKNEEAVIDIVQNKLKELGYESPSLRDKIKDSYVLI